MNHQDAIKVKLKSCKLDPEYWCKVLEENLGITSSDHLEFLDDDSYEDLAEHVHHAWEKKAIKKFLQTVQPQVNATENCGSEQKEADDGIKKILKDAGLNPEYWLKILKEKLNISIPEEVDNLGEESYQDLFKHKQHSREVKGIKKLLKMTEQEESSLKARREKKKKKLEDDQKKANELLTKLKELDKDGKERHEEQVKKIEDEVKQKLNISPEDWISKDKSLEELTTGLQSYIDNMGGILKERKDISEVKVLSGASGGLALKGILLSKKRKDQIRARSGKLLTVPSDIEFMQPSMQPYDETKVFHSKESEDNFNKTVDSVGFGASLSVNAKFWGIGVESSTSYSNKFEEERSSEKHVQEQYNSTIKYSFVPIASFQFEDTQFLLSHDALRDLQAIELIITKVTEDELQQKCVNFFEMYGSHAIKGDLHFGGIYQFKCSSKGFKESQLDQVKQLQSHVVTSSVAASYGPWGIGASVGVDWSRTNAKLTGKYSETLKSQVHIQVTKNGGPEEATDLQQWKNGLVASNSTWSLVDRGLKERESLAKVSVWKIIKMNHRTDFKDAKKLMRVLVRAWEKMTMLKEGSQCSEEVSLDEEEASDTLEKVAEWNERRDISKCEENLHELWGKKRKFAEEMNSHYWPELYLSKSPIQEYLIWVVSVKHDSSFKRLVRYLIEPSDLNAVRVFPKRPFILKWLYQTEQVSSKFKSQPSKCKDLYEFLEFIQKFLEELYLQEESIIKQIQIEITVYLVQVINDLQDYLKSVSSVDENLFLVTILCPLGYSSNGFAQLLTLHDLEYLKKEINYQIPQFKKVQNTRNLQTYLFHLTVSFIQKGFDHETQYMCINHLQYLQEELGSNLDPAMKSILSRHSIQSGLDSSYSWPELYQDLSTARFVEHTSTAIGSQFLSFMKTMELGVRHEFKPDRISHQSIKVSYKVFNILGLSEYYPQMLTRKNALCIHQKAPERNEIYIHILEEIKMNNYQYWKCLRQESEEFIVHPVDSLLALLLCADNFLRQDLIGKMATCQLALPILLSDPYAGTVTLPLWGMRSIVKEWKQHDTATGNETLMECCMIEHAVPMVSFMRFSDSDPDSAKTKSKILNGVVGDSKHDYFFYRDCEGGATKRVLMEGVVDLCWYLPAGKEDKLPEAVAFTNLHGSARNHSLQFNFLKQVSFIHFVLLTQADLNDDTNIMMLEELSEAQGELVLLFSDLMRDEELHHSELQLSKEFKVIKMKKQNLAVINREIFSHIAVKLLEHRKRSLQFRTLKSCSEIARKIGICVDEDDPECCAGQQMANIIIKEIKQSMSLKREMFPLQSQKFWHEWCTCNKERHRHINKGDISVPEYNDKMDDKKDEIRKQQLLKSDPPSYIMKLFISYLLEYKGAIRDYFLHSLKFLLDEISQQTLPPLLKEYDKCKCDLQKLPNDASSSDEKEKIRRNIAKVKSQINAASLGLEHFFRELGQMYESVMDVQIKGKRKKVINELRSEVSCLPALAVELLVAGFPLELMDGDASHVPMTWVRAMLDELHKSLTNANLFVVSVLGIQSSGKSTLLNTMFGIRFAVSAGRCTRGAFIQLLEIQKSSGPSDYLLVVDTEGLRAPELNQQSMLKHDNELATFVIGLANVTIINIKGETPSDIQDILQTSVHAFIRMSQVELKPSCQFVHQNVSSVSAETKLTHGKSNLVENLNEIVKYAAEQQDMETKYSMFDQVVSFDVEKDVWYFPSLWKGSPPMAPIDPGYSEKSKELKAVLITGAEKTPFTIENFKRHVTVLWESVLSESYVFSFKNMLEMTVYSDLDCKVGQWTRAVMSEILTFKIELDHKVYSCKLENLDSVKKEITVQLNKKIEELQKGLLKKAASFFEQNEHADIMVAWEAETKKKLVHLCQNHKDQIEDYCSLLVHNRKDRDSLDSLRTNITQTIEKPVRTLAMELRGKDLKEEELEREFNKMWTEQKTTMKFKGTSKVVVERSIEKCLIAFFKKEAIDKIHTKLSLCSLRSASMQFTLKESHFKVPKVQKSFTGVLTGVYNYVKYNWTSSDLFATFQAQANQQTDIFLNQAFEHINKVCKGSKDYSEALGFEVFQSVVQKFDEFNGKHENFRFTVDYKIDLFISVGGYSIRKFEEMIKMNDPATIMENLKKPSFVKFKNQVLQRKIEVGAAESLLVSLRDPVRTAVIESLVPLVMKRVSVQDSRFKSKHVLLYNIMLDLERKKRFADFSLHLTNIDLSMRAWIKEYTLQYCKKEESRQTKLEVLACNELKTKIMHLSSTADDINLTNPVNLKDWMTRFQNQLASSFPLNLDKLLEDTGAAQIVGKPDFNYFKEMFNEELNKLEKELTESFVSLHKQMESWETTPYTALADEMIGCSKQCPFCKAKCEYITPDHSGDHCVSVHHPRCLGGRRWQGSDIMVLELCTETIDSSTVCFKNEDTDDKFVPYNKYRDIYKDWLILPNSSRYNSSYWKYIVAHYTDEIADFFGIKKPPSGSVEDKVLQGWKKLEWEKVVEDLKGSFGL